MSRLPIRVRLTLAFAVAMAIVLAAMGAFVYVRVGGALESSVDQTLRAQAPEIAARLRAGRSIAERDRDDGVTLVRLVPAARIGGDSGIRTEHVTGHEGEWRVLREPLRLEGRSYTLTLSRSLRSREETLHHVFRGFLIGGPIALLLAALAGYGLAAAALRPVEAMRRRAQAISAETPGRRLPVPEARDEVTRLAETLNEMLARLEAAFAHERRFVADASHELRTPLALLRTELELALRHERSREELEAAIRSAAEETERLSRLAEDLLLIARADQGALPLRRVEVDTGDVLRRAAERLAPQASAHGRTIVVTDEAPTLLDADPDRLEQALGNLVENAILHGAGPITLSARTRDGLVELHVTDEGSGFPEDFLPRAFDRFSRSDDARSHGGTGLGLSIVQLVADAHAGTAGARNRAVGGADVWIAVPAAAVGSRRGSLSPA
jgi:signal transduction histidine kinase